MSEVDDSCSAGLAAAVEEEGLCGKEKRKRKKKKKNAQSA